MSDDSTERAQENPLADEWNIPSSPQLAEAVRRLRTDRASVGRLEAGIARAVADRQALFGCAPER